MTKEVGSEAILRKVAAAVALVEGEAGVRDLVAIVARLEPVSVRNISRASELPVPIVAAICAELRKRGVVARQRPVRLTPRGRALLGYDGPQELPLSVCPACEGREVATRPELAHVSAELWRVAEAAPRARAELDQSHCTVATKLRRVLFLHKAGALAGKRVLLLGDDDLMSIAIERVARCYGFVDSIREMAVVDVDPAVVAFCRARLPAAGFPVTFYEHDLREALPDRLRDGFDTVFTDPPFTPEGAELFLSRAATALAPGGGGSVFFCSGMKPPHESLRIQVGIAAMGFVIRRLARNFNEYVGAGTVAGVSHLYHLTSTNETRPLIGHAYAGPLFTGDRGPTRRYRCASCGAIEAVGHGQRWKTIGDLKRNRCARCGGTVFRPLPRRGERASGQVQGSREPVR